MNQLRLCHCTGFIGCQIPATDDRTDDVQDGVLKLSPWSTLTVINRSEDILLSFHSPPGDHQVALVQWRFYVGMGAKTPGFFVPAPSYTCKLLP